MKARDEKRTFWVWPLACALVLGSSVLWAGDFYVIPAGKKSYAPVAKTGQKLCYKSEAPWGACKCGTSHCPAGQDGGLEKGVAWPAPRFTDGGDGTVKDNLTALVWLQESNCYSLRTWEEALTDASTLADGVCSLSDGSSAGEWRVPTMKELLSLVDWGFHDPALSNASGTAKWTEGNPFLGVWGFCWSSTTYEGSTDEAWGLNFSSGSPLHQSKAGLMSVWPVRDAR